MDVRPGWLQIESRSLRESEGGGWLQVCGGCGGLVCVTLLGAGVREMERWERLEGSKLDR